MNSPKRTIMERSWFPWALLVMGFLFFTYGVWGLSKAFVDGIEKVKCKCEAKP